MRPAGLRHLHLLKWPWLWGNHMMDRSFPRLPQGGHVCVVGQDRAGARVLMCRCPPSVLPKRAPLGRRDHLFNKGWSL